MANVTFYCPDCAFKKDFSEDDIPSAAKQCICPSCRKTFDIADAIIPLNGFGAESCKDDEIRIDIPLKVDEEAKNTRDKYQKLLESGLTKLKEGEDLDAMALLEEAKRISSTPIVLSYLAYCRAKIKYEFSDAVSVCAHCVKEEPSNAEHYFNLARIYLLANKRKPALKIIRKGLKLGPHPELLKEFRKFDRRNPLLFLSLPREHFLNKNFGKLFYRLGFR